MARFTQWSGLTGAQRGLVVAGVGVDSLAKAAALRDLRRRPTAQIRGPKWLWVAAVVVTGSLGAVPALYFAFGRRAA